MSVRKLAAEAVGTALLVIFAVGAATLSFGFGLTGSSTSAGEEMHVLMKTTRKTTTVRR